VDGSSIPIETKLNSYDEENNNSPLKIFELIKVLGIRKLTSTQRDRSQILFLP